ncbi:ABC transporter permease subunit [Streptomyces sp. RFCAC02]|uniref:ABC transporter permease n=1 Tax=Streptomyces sp. RFCAC02 TaxID=2499143 RepID=UPI00101E8AF2|nr:ABC transporter permease subunit [Streptomyces sp. RFCAC02]
MTTPREAAPDRIHNIGYRRYDGARLGAGYARFSLFTHSLRGSYGLGRSGKSKVLPFGLFGVMAIPAVVMVAVASTTGMDELMMDYRSYGLTMQPVLGLYVALAAPQMVSLDLRFKTMPLYFARPIARADYVLAKYAALSASLFLFVGVPITVAYAGGLLAELGFADQTTAYLRGLVVTAVLAVLHAGIGLLVASLTPRRGFGVAAIIAVLTIPFFAVNALQVTASEQGSTGAVGWLAVFSPGTLLDAFQSSLLGGESGFIDGITPSVAAGTVCLLVIAGLAVSCHLLLLRRYRKAGL